MSDPKKIQDEKKKIKIKEDKKKLELKILDSRKKILSYEEYIAKIENPSH